MLYSSCQFGEYKVIGFREQRIWEQRIWEQKHFLTFTSTAIIIKFNG
ncbi:hypothetical protein LYNGBM3L_32110 [Moorena producens 3L]|uniref:Uncharacterized protein n=1 Tax=Moorena producens 3L TaxID=489825 RepID=F4XU91_9CYAN|nr:hypothetical protein LYNGBM3L_32110 [Moorena producens 3L]